MREIILGCDLDSVLNNLNVVWVAWLNNKYSLTVVPNDIECWDMQKTFNTLTKKQIYEPLYLESFWNEMSPVEDSQKYLHNLHHDGFIIKIVASSNLSTIEVKKDWVTTYYPFINREDIRISYNKQREKVDILIDDYELNLIGGTYRKILLDYPYNRACNDKLHGINRVYNWNDIYVRLSSRLVVCPWPKCLVGHWVIQEGRLIS